MAKKRERKDDQAAEQLARKVAASEKKEQYPEVIGQIRIDLETPDGETVTKIYRIRPGHPNFRVGKKIVSSSALFALATASVLTEEQKKNLDGLTQEEARAYIAHLAAIGSYMIEEV